MSSIEKSNATLTFFNLPVVSLVIHAAVISSFQVKVFPLFVIARCLDVFAGLN
jgi:hypothetical protein